MSADASRNAETTSALVLVLLRHAERLSHQKNRKSIRSLYAAAIEIDPTPVARIAYAVELGRSDPQSAIEELEIAWNESRRLNNPHWRANCCCNLAILFARTGNAALANQFRQLAISAELEAQHAASGLAFSTPLLNEISQGWISSGELTAATQLLEATETVADRAAPTEQAVTSSHLGVIAAICRETEVSQKLLLHAYRLCRAAGDWRGCGSLLMNLGHVSQIRCQHKAASRHFRVAASLYELIDDQTLAGAAQAYAQEAAARERLEGTNPLWN